jgi:hypothetical protein
MINRYFTEKIKLSIKITRQMVDNYIKDNKSKFKGLSPQESRQVARQNILRSKLSDVSFNKKMMEELVSKLITTIDVRVVNDLSGEFE